MQLKISRQEFQKALEIAHGISSRTNGIIDVTTKLVVRSDGKQKIVIGATDLTVDCLITMVNYEDKERNKSTIVNVSEEGGLCVNSKDILGIVKDLPGDVLDIKTKDNLSVQVKAGKSNLEIVGIDHHTFPALLSGAEAKLTKMQSSIFRDMIRKTAFSVARSDDRPNIACACFVCDGDKATMVSTDGHRMAKASEGIVDGPKFKENVMIPRAALSTIKGLIDTREVPCEVGVTAGATPCFVLKVQGHYGDEVSIAARLVAGDFPPWDQVIPKQYDRRIKISRTELHSSLKRALFFAENSSQIVWTLTSNGLTIKGHSQERGHVTEEVDVEFEGKGDKLEVGFNGKFLQEFLEAIEDQQVYMEFGDNLDPAVIRPTNDKTDYIGILMPMRLT